MTDSTENSQELATQSFVAPKRGISWLGLFALLVALAALGVGGFASWQLLQLRNLPNQVSNSADNFQQLTGQLTQLENSQARQSEALSDLEDSLADGLAAISDVPLRIEQVETLVNNIPGLKPKQRADWLRAEALYYLRIANAQATLTGNAEVASRALELADEKLRDTGDPRLAAVRAQLSDEVTALRAMPSIDREGISFRLQSLIAQASNLDFKVVSPESFRPEIELPEGEMGPWERLQGTLKSVFSTIISVKKVDGPPIEQQLDVTERALIVENLRSELQISRLAFLSNNADLFQTSLQQSADQIQRYFDTDTEAVGAALETIAELSNTVFPGPVPDISGSLAMFLDVSAEP